MPFCVKRLWIPLLTLAIWLGPLYPASAIIMRHDVDEDEYIVDDADWPALVDLFEPGDCIGTLIHEYFILTVAHCAEDLRDSQPMMVDGTRFNIAEIIMHPNWDGWNFDVALVRFETPVEGITPYPIYRADDELGQTMILVGRGVHATGLEGEPGASDDGILRRATNIVTSANQQWLEVYFDSPDEEGVTDLEGVGAGGDSGGPAFIETEDGLFIAGLNSWGDADSPIRIGQYGAYDYSTRVSQQQEWIDSVVGPTDTGDGNEPDAGTGTPDTGTGTPDTGTGTPDAGTPDMGVDMGADLGSSDAGSGSDTGGGGPDATADAGSTESDCDTDDHDGDDDDGGCGCSSGSPAAAGWIWLLAMGALIRRRGRPCVGATP